VRSILTYMLLVENLQVPLIYCYALIDFAANAN